MSGILSISVLLSYAAQKQKSASFLWVRGCLKERNRNAAYSLHRSSIPEFTSTFRSKDITISWFSP